MPPAFENQHHPSSPRHLPKEGKCLVYEGDYFPLITATPCWTDGQLSASRQGSSAYLSAPNFIAAVPDTFVLR